MKKISFITGLFAFMTGFILILGTAGASDLGHIPISHILPRLAVGSILTYTGVALIDIARIGGKKESEHHNH